MVGARRACYGTTQQKTAAGKYMCDTTKLHSHVITWGNSDADAQLMPWRLVRSDFDCYRLKNITIMDRVGVSAAALFPAWSRSLRASSTRPAPPISRCTRGRSM